MGCDIHAHIEVETTMNNMDDDCLPYIKHFAKISITRDYILFAHMAGIRDSNNEFKHVSEPKGMPSEISYQTLNEYTTYVIDDKNFSEEDSEFCPRSKAEEYVNKGYTKWWDDNKSFIVNSDWHSPSWLSIEELEEVLKLYCSNQIEDWSSILYEEKMQQKMDFLKSPKMVDMPPNRDLLGIIGAMKSIRDENHEPRLVFWFDN
jgi:hypothetical protein